MRNKRTDLLYQDMAIEASMVREEIYLKAYSALDNVRSLLGQYDAKSKGGKLDMNAIMAECQNIEKYLREASSIP